MHQRTIDHYYVYVHRPYGYLYERTCGTQQAADERVKELKERGEKHAVWLLNALIAKAYY